MITRTVFASGLLVIAVQCSASPSRPTPAPGARRSAETSLPMHRADGVDAAEHLALIEPSFAARPASPDA